MSAVHESDVAPMIMTAVAILVAQGHGLTLDELRTPTRRPSLVAVRREAMRRLRHPGLAGKGGRQYTQQEIGDFFGVTAQAVSWAMLDEPPSSAAVPKARAPSPPSLPEASYAARAKLAVAKHSGAFEALFAQAFADGGFGALHHLIETTRNSLAKREQGRIFWEGWIV